MAYYLVPWGEKNQPFMHIHTNLQRNWKNNVNFTTQLVRVGSSVNLTAQTHRSHAHTKMSSDENQYLVGPPRVPLCTCIVVVVYFQTDIYMYNIPKCYYIQLIICIYSLRLHQKVKPVMMAQPWQSFPKFMQRDDTQ